MRDEMSLQQAYAPERMGREWGYRDAVYATGRHRGQDVRKQNENGTASVVTDVIAIHEGRIVYVGRPNNLLELTFVIDRGEGIRGRYEFHSHCADPSVGVGAKVMPGDRLARNARLDERPGLITGSHDHIVISDWSDGAWNTNRATYDPAPFIKTALAKLASGNIAASPLDTEEEYDMKPFVAVVRGNWHLVIPQGNAKPRGILLDGSSNITAAGYPVVNFNEKFAVEGIKAAVDGIFG